MEKHLAAQILYNDGIDQKVIAQILKCSEPTVGSWKKKYEWERKKTENILARETSEETLWKLIGTQLEILEYRSDEMKKLPKDKWTLIDKGDIDALSKMFSSVKGKQLEWSNYVRVCKELLEQINSIDSKLALDLSTQIAEFLNQKRTNL